MLNYNEITEKKYIVLDGDPYEVVESHVFRKQQRKPVNATKLRNLLTGKVSERSFHVSEKAQEADISRKEIKYLYNNKGVWWFCRPDNPSQRFSLDQNLVGENGKFLKENSVIDALVFDNPKDEKQNKEDEIIGVKIPIKIDLLVKEAEPAVKGDTAKGGNKIVTLETGAKIQVPLFVKEGDVVRVNTETGQYTDRVIN
ncbi:MAG: elongation factor P [Candidatus Zambryskibacteria bacterium CG_4_9_14_3_um_filter_40_16]|uniref:Elongation factor P n=2 Tax=Candidatus Zambryskiibacteriota TaxID=1817925 RepID=A0A2H0K9V4_9BACT|nr:MAG: elongation factor P [Candidatus Zambryskibacteria bacterium CG11_big_fil_rev_8_21_14_0_20_40_24]PJA33622.1 MAG: elongation factor P [Candidatus Zambryskibacteria bacterium CG_4_9_14_3_um_filter_40_16]